MPRALTFTRTDLSDETILVPRATVMTVTAITVSGRVEHPIVLMRVATFAITPGFTMTLTTVGQYNTVVGDLPGLPETINLVPSGGTLTVGAIPTTDYGAPMSQVYTYTTPLDPITAIEITRPEFQALDPWDDYCPTVPLPFQ